MPGPLDVALVSLGTTPGLRRADEALAELLERAGVRCALERVTIGRAARLRRHPALTDLVESLAARRAAARTSARVTIFSTVTAALLARRRGPYAVRFDSPAALNRPGAAGAWQRARERRVLTGARLLLPWSEAAAVAAPAPGVARVVLAVPIEQHAPAAGDAASGGRDVDALAYAGDPHKRGLDLLCEAWARAASADQTLLVGGIEPERARGWLARRGVREPAGIEWAGRLDRRAWLDTVARARLFVNASRREDYGIAQLEALSAGAALVTVPSAGAYEGLALARQLDARLVAEVVSADALAETLDTALALGDTSAYAQRALTLLEPYRPATVARVVAERVLPGLGLA